MSGAGFDGQSVLVTGGGHGIGAAIGAGFAAQSARVALTGRDPVQLGVTADRLGNNVRGFACDLTDDAAATGAMAKVRDWCGVPDVLVLCAGFRDASDQPLADRDLTAFTDTMTAATRMALAPVMHFASDMAARGSGRIILMSGVFGIRGWAGHSASVAAKWAQEGITRTLALELGRGGMTVNAICPGYVEGARMEATMQAKAERTDTGVDTLKAQLAEGIPTGRFSTEAQIAEAALFLAGPGAANITGQDIIMDGGWTL